MKTKYLLIVGLVLSFTLLFGYVMTTTVMPIVTSTVMRLLTSNRQGFTMNVELHCITEHYRNGVLISYENHAMSLTDYGKNWLADKGFGTLLTNTTLFATYISTSNSSAAFDAAWTAIPTEHLASSTGLGRSNATYLDTGVGTFNLTFTYTSLGTYSTQTYGLGVDSYANWPTGGTIAAEVQASAKNMAALDTLAVTIMGTEA